MLTHYIIYKQCIKHTGMIFQFVLLTIIILDVMLAPYCINKTLNNKINLRNVLLLDLTVSFYLCIIQEIYYVNNPTLKETTVHMILKILSMCNVFRSLVIILYMVCKGKTII